MVTERIKGVVCPCITPFTPDGEVDEKLFVPYLSYLADEVDWISVGAIYGSGILMSLEQRKLLFDIAAEELNGRAKLSAFVGATDTETSVNLAIHADSVGADAISCVEPFYYRQVDKALLHHFRAIVDVTELPVYVYDSPIYAGNEMSFDVLNLLADDGLAGIITGAATDGIEHLYAVMRHVDHEKFDVLSIRDGLALPAMAMGSLGFESGVANFFPELVVELYEAVSEKQFARASELQKRALRLRDVSHSFDKNIPTLHALIELRGFSTGVPKAPFFLLSDGEKTRLKKMLRGLGFSVPLNL